MRPAGRTPEPAPQTPETRFAPRALLSLAGLAAAVAVVLAVAPSLAQEGEASKTLIPGKGSDLTMARCATCHDAGHITRARLSRGQWEDNVQNMKERGAPLGPDEIPIIIEYLATYYSNEPAPPPDPSAAGHGMSGGGDPMTRVLSAHGCVACHTIDKRVVGPSFREVAAKFAADADAAPRLAKKIREGGAGNWGNVPMPPHPQVPDAELNQMVAWILQQK